MKTSRKAFNKPLLTLFSVIVLDLIGFGIVIPILPFYAETYGANAFTLGLILTSYAGMQFLFSPLWGKLSDKIGRKNVLLMTMSGAILGMLILAMAPSLLWLFVGRIVAGIFGANISVATAYVTDITTEENRAKGMGLIGAAFGIGFILGPALGGLLASHENYAIPFYFAAALGLLNVLYASRSLQEVHSKTKEVPPRLLQVLKSPGILQFCLLNFFFTAGVTQLEATFAFFMMKRFNYDARAVAYILVLMALIMVLVQGGLIRRLAPRFGERNLLLFGGALLALAFIAVPSSITVAWLLIPLSISSLGRGIAQPSLMSLVSKLASSRERGAVMGSFQSAASLARILGPVTAGFLFDRNSAYPFYFAALLMGVVWSMVLFNAKVKTHSVVSEAHT